MIYTGNEMFVVVGQHLQHAPVRASVCRCVDESMSERCNDVCGRGAALRARTGACFPVSRV
jgi:hypothetical protein